MLLPPSIISAVRLSFFNKTCLLEHSTVPSLSLAMAANANKVLARLSTLDESLDALEAQLEPLFAQTLPETIAGLDKIQQAKLQVAIPYIVYDLIFGVLSIRACISH